MGKTKDPVPDIIVQADQKKSRSFGAFGKGKGKSKDKCEIEEPAEEVKVSYVAVSKVDLANMAYEPKHVVTSKGETRDSSETSSFKDKLQGSWSSVKRGFGCCRSGNSQENVKNEETVEPPEITIQHVDILQAHHQEYDKVSTAESVVAGETAGENHQDIPVKEDPPDAAVTINQSDSIKNDVEDGSKAESPPKSVPETGDLSNPVKPIVSLSDATVTINQSDSIKNDVGDGSKAESPPKSVPPNGEPSNTVSLSDATVTINQSDSIKNDVEDGSKAESPPKSVPPTGDPSDTVKPIVSSQQSDTVQSIVSKSSGSVNQPRDIKTAP